VLHITNYIESIFIKLGAFQTSQKTLTMLDFLDKCVGHRQDRGACGANAQRNDDLLAHVRRMC
jgi:hypothetical protein